MITLAVLGAGPTGLEAALAGVQRGWDVTVYEQAPRVAGHVRDWGHVRMFTPWAMNVSPRAAALVGVPAAAACPTGDEYAAHLDRVAAHLPDVRLSTQVLQVAREGLLKNEEIGTAARGARPFRLLVRRPDGREVVERADVVLDCTGTYGGPLPAGQGGIPAPGERGLEHRIVRRIPRFDGAWARRRALLVGAGFSAQTAARDLAAAGADVTWAVRRERPVWGAVEGDSLPDRAALVRSSERLAEGAVPGARVLRGVTVEEFREEDGDVVVTLRRPGGESAEVRADVVVSLTGGIGDSGLYRQLQVHECYATEGPIALAATLLGAAGGDCLAQTSAGVDVLRNPEPRFFVLGSKSYGRTNTFLLRVGWEQVAEVVDALDAELAVAA